MNLDLRPSYQNGFFPRDGEPAYPELWDNIAGVWCPALGATGEKLLDWSENRNHGTLTSMDLSTAWTVSEGRTALLFDGVDDKVSFGNVYGEVLQGDYTVSMFIKTTSTSLSRLIGKADYTAGGFSNSPFSVLFNYPTAGRLRLYIGTAADANSLASATADLNNGNLRHVAFQRIGSTQNIFIDGNLDATQSRATSPDVNSSNFTIGHDGSADGVGTQQFAGHVDDTLLFRRVLSLSELRVRYQLGPGGIFALADSPAARVAADFNRRRRLLISSGAA